MDFSLVFNLFRCLFIKFAYVLVQKWMNFAYILKQIIVKIDTDNPM